MRLIINYILPAFLLACFFCLVCSQEQQISEIVEKFADILPTEEKIADDAPDSTNQSTVESIGENQHGKLWDQMQIHSSEIIEVNSTSLAERILNSTEPRIFSMILVYAKWCPFCCEFYPTYDALARAFPNLPALAIEFGQHAAVSAWLPVPSLPTVLIYNGSTLAGHYHGSRTLQSMYNWITLQTELEPLDNIEITMAPITPIAKSTAPVYWAVGFMLVMAAATSIAKAEGLNGLFTSHLKID